MPTTRRRSGRRRFGQIAQLGSGNYRARYVGPDKILHTAPTTYTTWGYADAWLADEWRLIEAGQWTPPKQRAVRNYLDEMPRVAQWIETVIADRSTRSQNPIKPSTADLYRKDARIRINPHLGDIPLDEVTTARVNTWRRKLDQLTHTPTSNGRAWDTLRTCLEAAVEDELISSNPCTKKGLGKPKPKHRDNALSYAELKAYSDIVTEWAWLTLMIEALCGLRSGEARALRRCDVDLANQQLTIREAVSRIRANEHSFRWYTDTPKTLAGSRTVAIHPVLTEPIRKHMATMKLQTRNARLFHARHDPARPLSDSTIRDHHKRAVAAIGRPEVTMHDLRRTAATLAGQSGATVKELMSMLGHTTPNMAMHYQVADAVRQRQVAERMAAQMKAAGIDLSR